MQKLKKQLDVPYKYSYNQHKAYILWRIVVLDASDIL